jgi:hypothetical protein
MGVLRLDRAEALNEESTVYKHCRWHACSCYFPCSERKKAQGFGALLDGCNGVLPRA